MTLSNDAENKVLEHIVGKTNYAKPTAYIALSTAEILETDTGDTLTEPSGGYARVETTGSDWDASTGGLMLNATLLAFPKATSDWGTITDVALVDAATSGNVIEYRDLVIGVEILKDDIASFPIGYIALTCD